MHDWKRCLGNPWLIKECITIRKRNEPREITISEKLNMIRKHLNYLMKIKPEKVAVLECVDISLVSKRCPNRIKEKIVECKTSELESLLNDFEKVKRCF